MRRRLQVGCIGLGATVVAASLLVMTTASGSESTGAGAKAVATTSGAVAQMSQVRTGVKRTLLSKEGTVQPGTFDGAVGTCPRRFPTPVSGWFSAVSDKVVLAQSIPLGKKKWATGVVNLDTAPSDYIVGVVCVK